MSLKHPHYQTAKERQREDFNAEIASFLVEQNDRREIMEGKRILEGAEE